MLSVVLPDTSEMWLSRDSSWSLVREHHVLFLEHLWGHFAESLVFSSVLILSLWGGGVHSKHQLSVLVSVGEGVESSFLLALIVGLSEITSLLSPRKLWDLIVEHASSMTSNNGFESEPLERVSFITTLLVSHWSHLSLQVVKGVIPGLARVSVSVPLFVVLSLGPVWDSESLEDGSGSSVEGDVTHTLIKGVWVEVLSIEMVHDEWLLVELILIGVLDSKALFTSLLNMESVSDVEQVWVDEAHSL